MGIWWSLGWYLPIVALLLLLGGRPLVALLARVGRPVAYFWVLAAGGLLAAQLLLPGRSLYPFAAWTMYSDPAPQRATWGIFLFDQKQRPHLLPHLWSHRGLDTRAAMGAVYNELYGERNAGREFLSADSAERIGAFARGIAGNREVSEARSMEVRWCEWSGPWPGLEAACFQAEPVAVVPLGVP